MMMSSEWKPPSMPKSQDTTDTIIGKFTEITVSNSDNDLYLVGVKNPRLNGWMPVIPEVEIWKTVFLWIILSLLFFNAFGSQPSTNGIGTSFYHLRDKSSWVGVSLCAGSATWLPYVTNQLGDFWVHTFAYVEQGFRLSLFLSYCCTGLCSPGGVQPTRGRM